MGSAWLPHSGCQPYQPCQPRRQLHVAGCPFGDNRTSQLSLNFAPSYEVCSNLLEKLNSDQALLRNIKARRREGKALEIKARRCGAAHECPITGGLRSLPMALRNDDQRHLSAGKVGAEGMIHAWALVRGRERQDQWRAGIEVPYLGCIDLVLLALFARFK